MRHLIILSYAAFALLAGCRGGAGAAHDHNHEEHTHTVGEHEDHDHAAGKEHDLAEGEEHDHEGGAHPEGEIVFTRAQAEAAGLETETVIPAPFSEVIKTSGRVEVPTADEVTVVAASSGVVSFAPGVTEGVAVAKGQAIASVSGRGMVEGDDATKARAEFEAAEGALRRAEELVKDKIVSRRDFDEARRRYLAAGSALGGNATSGAGVRVASPLSGYVKGRLVAEGEFVAAGQTVVTVVREGRLQLRAEVSERHASALPHIRGANFKSPYSPTVYHAQRLVSYGRGSVGGWIPVLLEFEGVADVVDGATVEVWLRGAPTAEALSIPRSALTEEQGLHFVYIKLGAEEYVKREVVTGADDGERVLVKRGLSPGDEVVTRGAVQVRLAAMSGIIPEGHSHSH